MRTRLERLNDWCGKFMDKLIRYDDLITFSFFALMLMAIIFSVIVTTLGIFGAFK